MCARGCVGFFWGFLFYFVHYLSKLCGERRYSGSGIYRSLKWKSEKKSQRDTSKGDFCKMFLVLVIHMLLCDDLQLLPVSLSMGQTDGLSMAH